MLLYKIRVGKQVTVDVTSRMLVCKTNQMYAPQRRFWNAERTFGNVFYDLPTKILDG